MVGMEDVVMVGLFWAASLEELELEDRRLGTGMEISL